MILYPDEPLAQRLVHAIRQGERAGLERLLQEHPELATARIGPHGERTPLHVATDWPGPIPNGPEIVRLLVSRGADVNAQFHGDHEETPLHWAASNDDVPMLDALLDAGANIEAPGAVTAGGTPLADAVAFGQWRAARRLLERGARTTLWEAAALGLTDRVAAAFSAAEPPSLQQVNTAFWCACHGGQRQTAEYLLERGANRNWVGFDQLTPLDAARRRGAQHLAAWLQSQNCHSAQELA